MAVVALAWTAAEWVKIRKPTSIGIVTGCAGCTHQFFDGSGREPSDA